MRYSILILWCSLSLLVSHGLVFAATPQIITVGKSGPPRYDFSSLQAVHDWLKSGSGGRPAPLTIRLFSDEFPEKTLIWTLSGQEDAPILIQGMGRIFFSGARIKSDTYGKPVLILSWVSHITLENIGFRDFSARAESRVGLEISGKGKNIICNCWFSNFFGPKSEAAISLYNHSSDNLIEKCRFDSLGDDIYMHAVYLNKDCSNNLIRDNMITSCSGEAFMVRNNSNNNHFENNTIIRCGGVAYYGEWYNTDIKPAELPSHGNRITGARGGGPSARSAGYVKPGYIRKVRALNWSRYKWPNYKADWNDTTLAYYMPDAGRNQLATVSGDLAVQSKNEIDTSPGYLRFTNAAVYQAQIEPAGSIEGARLELVYSDTTNRWGGKESYLQEVRIHDTSSRPRRFTTTLRVRTLEGDVIGELVPVRQLTGSTDGPLLVPLEGAGQSITCALTGLQGDYDLFILSVGKSLSREKLNGHFKDKDGGAKFFVRNALAVSRNDGKRDEKITLTLEKGKEYTMVICRKDTEKGSCLWSAKP
jgi:hypothetical protein